MFIVTPPLVGVMRFVKLKSAERNKRDLFAFQTGRQPPDGQRALRVFRKPGAARARRGKARDLLE